MAEVHCVDNCTTHAVELDDTEKLSIAEMFSGIDITHIIATYDETTEEVVLRLKEAR